MHRPFELRHDSQERRSFVVCLQQPASSDALSPSREFMVAVVGAVFEVMLNDM